MRALSSDSLLPTTIITKVKMIQKNEAKLATLSIDIQAIRVNGKRMSLAAFKQLPKSLTIEDGSDVWGYVNYRIKKDKKPISRSRDGIRPLVISEPDHWIVYSRNGKLYRYPAKHKELINLPQLFIAV